MSEKKGVSTFDNLWARAKINHDASCSHVGRGITEFLLLADDFDFLHHYFAKSKPLTTTMLFGQNEQL